MKKKIAQYADISIEECRLTVPTILTIIRIALIPCIVLSIRKQWFGWACLLFFVAAITDFLDGYIARRFALGTVLGTILDPIADKLLTIFCFISLSIVQPSYFVKNGIDNCDAIIPLWFVLFFCAKEILLMIGSYWLYRQFGVAAILPTWLGKTTMTILTIFLGSIFCALFFQWSFGFSYQIMLFVIIGIVAASLIEYIMRGIKLFL